MPLNNSELTPPYSVAVIPFGGTSATGGTQPTTNTLHRVFFCERPTQIVGFQLCLAAVEAGVTYRAQYVDTVTAGTAVNMGVATNTLAAAGVLSLDVDTATPSGIPPILAPGSFVGFLTSNTATTAARITHVIIKYRCPA